MSRKSYAIGVFLNEIVKLDRQLCVYCVRFPAVASVLVHLSKWNCIGVLKYSEMFSLLFLYLLIDTSMAGRMRRTNIIYAYDT